MEFLKGIYGEDSLGAFLLLTFEFLSYLLAGFLGSTIREIFLEQKKRVTRIIGSSILSALILFVTSSLIKNKIEDSRLIFGLGAVLGFYIPNFMSAISSGRIIKYVARVVSIRLYEAIKEWEADEEKESNKKE